MTNLKLITQYLGLNFDFQNGGLFIHQFHCTQSNNYIVDFHYYRSLMGKLVFLTCALDQTSTL
jgi:hypothetical protein